MTEPVEIAARELQEEAGLIAAHWEPIGGVLHISNCISSEVGYLFLATDLSETEPTPDPTEVLEIRRVPFSDALDMVISGDITDAMSIIGILRAARMMEGG